MSEDKFMRWFNNLKISKKFGVIAGVIFPLLILLGGIGVWGTTIINGFLQETQNVQTPSIYKLANATQDVITMRVDYRQLILDTDPQKIQADITNLKTSTQNARQHWDEYVKLPSVEAERALWPTFESEWKTWTQYIDQMIALAQQGSPDSHQKALDLLATAAGSATNVADVLQKLSDINLTGANDLANQARDTFGTTIITIVIVSLLAILITVAAGTILARSIIVPINKLQKATQAVADGDLTVALEVKTKDEVGELGKAFNVMLDSLSELNREISRAAKDMNGSAAELLALMNQQTAGASEQSAAIHQTSSTVNEVKATIEQTNQQARSMSDTALRSASIAEEGQSAVTETVNGMSQIKEQVETIAENILALSEQTQQIGEIIATVNDIAEQSNLLALNASVEAARAGEHGRGFAVVANEVRSLAERSKQATSQVRTILSDIQKATNAVVMVTEEGTKGVDHGVRLVDRAGLTIRQLGEAISQSLMSTQQIMAVVQQQNAGVEQVAQAMSNINEVTSQNVSSNRQLQQSVENLSRQAGRFEELTSRYRLVETKNGWISKN
ncbi:MAG TPA: methyl-accepting chemotaxis protein [Chloroflexia bacterium]|nr:methyl-accepting chemotaxis protein [Chloroflexia bacterium]